MAVVLGMTFLIFSNIDVQFAKKEIIWKNYTTKKALSTTHQVKLVDQKKYAKVVLDKNIEVFVTHVSFLGLKLTIHLVRKAWIALLLAEKVTVPAKYSDFANVFLEESANIYLQSKLESIKMLSC